MNKLKFLMVAVLILTILICFVLFRPASDPQFQTCSQDLSEQDLCQCLMKQVIDRKISQDKFSSLDLSQDNNTPSCEFISDLEKQEIITESAFAADVSKDLFTDLDEYPDLKFFTLSIFQGDTSVFLLHKNEKQLHVLGLIGSVFNPGIGNHFEVGRILGLKKISINSKNIIQIEFLHQGYDVDQGMHERSDWEGLFVSYCSLQSHHCAASQLLRSFRSKRVRFCVNEDLAENPSPQDCLNDYSDEMRDLKKDFDPKSVTYEAWNPDDTESDFFGVGRLVISDHFFKLRTDITDDGTLQISVIQGTPDPETARMIGKIVL